MDRGVVNTSLFSQGPLIKLY